MKDNVKTTYDNPLEELLDLVSKQEDYYYDLANKAMEELNMLANQVCVSKAASYQRVRYTIEDMIQKEKTKAADNKLTAKEKRLIIQVAQDRVDTINNSFNTRKYTDKERNHLITVVNVLSSATSKIEKS